MHGRRDRVSAGFPCTLALSVPLDGLTQVYLPELPLTAAVTSFLCRIGVADTVDSVDKGD